jgi:hypothetical protein
LATQKKKGVNTPQHSKEGPLSDYLSDQLLAGEQLSPNSARARKKPQQNPNSF